MAILKLCFFFLSSVCVNASQAKQTIKIGYVAGLSGPGVSAAASESAAILQQYINSVSSNASQFNVVVKKYDNKFEASRNIEVFKAMLDDHVDIITGLHYSNDGLIIAPLAEKAGIPTIVTTASHPEIPRDKKWVHRVNFSDERQADSLVRAIEAKVSGRIVLVRDLKNSFSITLTEMIDQRLRRRSKISKIQVVDVSRGSIEPEKVVAELGKLTSQDGVFLSTGVQDSAAIIAAVNSRSLRPSVFGSDAWASLEIEAALQSYGNSSQNALFVSHWVSDRNSVRWKRFAKTARDAGFEPSFHLADPIATYEAGVLIMAILSKMKKFTPEIFNKHVRNTSIEGVLGPLSIGSNGESGRLPKIVEIRKSKVVGPWNLQKD